MRNRNVGKIITNEGKGRKEGEGERKKKGRGEGKREERVKG